MPYDPNLHHRKSCRLPGHDYRLPGWYFVTICTKNRECHFGEIINGRMILSPIGKIVQREWQRTHVVRPYVRLDAFVVMPNHIHGIIVIENNDVTVGALRRNAPTHPTLQTRTSLEKNGHVSKISPLPNSLPTIIRSFKSKSTKIIHERFTIGPFAWQRLYHDRIIRDADELEGIRWYIRNNPRAWGRDRNNA